MQQRTREKTQACRRVNATNNNAASLHKSGACEQRRARLQDKPRHEHEEGRAPGARAGRFAPPARPPSCALPRGPPSPPPPPPRPHEMRHSRGAARGATASRSLVVLPRLDAPLPRPTLATLATLRCPTRPAPPLMAHVMQGSGMNSELMAFRMNSFDFAADLDFAANSRSAAKSKESSHTHSRHPAYHQGGSQQAQSPRPSTPTAVPTLHQTQRRRLEENRTQIPAPQSVSIAVLHASRAGEWCRGARVHG